ncbi:MAG TPA: hypothetical protein VEK12_07345 [Alphaproteobacteria bacterium]|nr:hypothetical protein [Alphaproteobacteria bacterium]
MVTMNAGRIGPGLDRIECAIIAILTRTRHLSTQLLTWEVAAPFAQPSPMIYASVRKAADHLQREGILRRTRYGEWMLADPTAQSETKERLASILGMLGSAHDGEILAAARAAEAERKRLGATWRELLSVSSPAVHAQAA